MERESVYRLSTFLSVSELVFLAGILQKTSLYQIIINEMKTLLFVCEIVLSMKIFLYNSVYHIGPIT